MVLFKIQPMKHNYRTPGSHIEYGQIQYPPKPCAMGVKKPSQYPSMHWLQPCSMATCPKYEYIILSFNQPLNSFIYFMK